MKRSIFFILLIIGIQSNIFSQEKEVRKTSLDFYPLPMLLGEFGGELSFSTSEKTSIGLQLTYYNPKFGLTGILINNQLGKNDELTLNVHSFLPAIAFTVYTKPEMSGFYYGALLRLKTGNGYVIYYDNYATDKSQNSATVRSDISILTINPNIIGGYRWAFKNNFSLKLGLATGLQFSIYDNVSYTILEQESEDDGNDAMEGMKDDIDIYLKSYRKPFTFQLVVGLGFTF